jgi:outer membrane protein OmpA-like peptidoglycan-associated protein
MRKTLVLAALLAVVAAPAMAQDKGSVEIGAFGKFTKYDKSYGTSEKSTNSYGGGARLGYFLTKKWELELDGSSNATDVKEFFVGYTSVALTYWPFHLRAIYNQKLGEDGPFTWLIGAGPAYNRYGKDIPGQPGFKGSDVGIGALTGFRASLTNWLAARLDGTLDYIPSPNNAKDAIINQANGITAAAAASKNLNLGAQLGLSVIPNGCSRAKDGTTISPTTATIQTGGSASFSGTATNCGKADEVVFTVSGPGSVDAATGRYTAAGPGTATVMACGRKNRLCSTATVIVNAPPPPPPPRTMNRCELTPATAMPRIDQPVQYSVTGYYSDNTSASLPNAALAAPGGSVSGNSVSWSTPGNKTITANCGGGLSASASADVQQLLIVVRDSAYFNVDRTVIYRTEDQGQLDAIAKILIEHPDIRLVIDGHTDADASVAHNEKLGMNRAIAMKTYLGKRGVPVDRMTIVLRTFGECMPVASNATAEGRTQNRRAELREFGVSEPGPGNAACAEAGRERMP